MDNTQEINKQLVVKIQDPFDPKYLPKNPARQKLIKGKKINERYILN